MWRQPARPSDPPDDAPNRGLPNASFGEVLASLRVHETPLTRERGPLPWVRDSLLQARGRRDGAVEPRLPEMRVRGLASRRQGVHRSRRAAPLRLGSAASPLLPIRLTPPK